MGLQRVLFDHYTRPHGVEQIGFGDSLVWAAEQDVQYVERATAYVELALRAIEASLAPPQPI